MAVGSAKSDYGDFAGMLRRLATASPDWELLEVGDSNYKLVSKFIRQQFEQEEGLWPFSRLSLFP